jgi:hypothetical protein
MSIINSINTLVVITFDDATVVVVVCKVEVVELTVWIVTVVVEILELVNVVCAIMSKGYEK